MTQIWPPAAEAVVLSCSPQPPPACALRGRVARSVGDRGGEGGAGRVGKLDDLVDAQ